MNKKYLFIVEGSKDEPALLSGIFKKYGQEVRTLEKINIALSNNNFRQTILEQNTYILNGDVVFIAQGPKTRISELLRLYDSETENFDRLFLGASELFAGIFLIYDVDHTSNGDLVKIFNKFQDESSGMLLLNSPCLEILAEPRRKQPIVYEHLYQYKRELNKKLNESIHCSIIEYITNNFESLVLYYLDKNREEFNCVNVMEHPQKIVEKINSENFRGKNESGIEMVKYRYFTTVIYVSIAYIMGLTKFTDNYKTVRKFFESKLKNL